MIALITDCGLLSITCETCLYWLLQLGLCNSTDDCRYRDILKTILKTTGPELIDGLKAFVEAGRLQKSSFHPIQNNRTLKLATKRFIIVLPTF